jgi:DNA-binding beta-propeller fold protein YncE
LYVAGAFVFTVYKLSDDPAVAPAVLSTWQASDGQLRGVAVVDDGPLDLVWVLSYSQVMEGNVHLVYRPLYVRADGLIQFPAEPTYVDGGSAGEDGPYSLGASPDRSLVYCADGDGVEFWGPTVTRFAVDSRYGLSQAGRPRMPGDALGLAVAPDGTLYVAAGGSVIHYDRSFNVLAQQVVGNWESGTGLRDLAVGGDALFVARAGDMLVLDPTTLQPLRSPLGVAVDGIAASRDGMRLYATGAGGAVSVIVPTGLIGGTPA